MKIYELIEFNKELLRKLFSAGVKTEDYIYADLFADYRQMHGSGEKTTYIVAVLAEKYDMSERKVYSIVKHLGKDFDCCK